MEMELTLRRYMLVLAIALAVGIFVGSVVSVSAQGACPAGRWCLTVWAWSQHETSKDDINTSVSSSRTYIFYRYRPDPLGGMSRWYGWSPRRPWRVTNNRSTPGWEFGCAPWGLLSIPAQLRPSLHLPPGTQYVEWLVITGSPPACSTCLATPDFGDFGLDCISAAQFDIRNPMGRTIAAWAPGLEQNWHIYYDPQ